MTPASPRHLTLIGFDDDASERIRRFLACAPPAPPRPVSFSPTPVEARRTSQPRRPTRSHGSGEGEGIVLVGDGVTSTPGEIARTRRDRATAKVLVVSNRVSASSILAALRAGADGYLEATAPYHQLVAALEAIDRGEVALSPLAVRRLVESLAPRRPSTAFPLSDREWQVAELLVEGLRYRDIAARLFISLETVRTHVRRIYRKLAVRSRAELVARWIRV
ncbi:MAG: response regulator transcription factor [Acidobacteriota bacterium]